MNCNQCEQMIFDLPFSATEGNLELSIQEHISGCELCRKLLTRHLTEMQRYNNHRRIQPDPLLYDRLLSQMDVQANESNASTGKNSRIVRLSPALMSAAAAILLGIWIGGRLTMNLETTPVNSASRQLMLDAVAQDLNLLDVSETTLENYFTENENPVQP